MGADRWVSVGGGGDDKAAAGAVEESTGALRCPGDRGTDSNCELRSRETGRGSSRFDGPPTKLAWSRYSWRGVPTAIDGEEGALDGVNFSSHSTVRTVWCALHRS